MTDAEIQAALDDFARAQRPTPVDLRRPWTPLLVWADREENQYVSFARPALGYALDGYLRARVSGEIDQEGRLRLLFLCWYSYAEGADVGLPVDEETSTLFSTLFDEMGGEGSTDAEFLFVAGALAGSGTHALDQSRDWPAVGRRCWAAAFALRPEGWHPREFAGRGAMGSYFAHVLNEGDGFSFLGQRRPGRGEPSI